MSATYFSKRDSFRFLKVEEYFRDYKRWERLPTKVSSCDFKYDENMMVINFKRETGTPCSILVHFLQDDTFRIRFNPTKTSEDFHYGSTPSSNFDDISRLLESK